MSSDLSCLVIRFRNILLNIHLPWIIFTNSSTEIRRKTDSGKYCWKRMNSNLVFLKGILFSEKGFSAQLQCKNVSVTTVPFTPWTDYRGQRTVYVYLSKSNQIAVKTEVYARVTNSTQMYSSEVQRGLQKFECKYLFSATYWNIS